MQISDCSVNCRISSEKNTKSKTTLHLRNMKLFPWCSINTREAFITVQKLRKTRAVDQWLQASRLVNDWSMTCRWVVHDRALVRLWHRWAADDLSMSGRWRVDHRAVTGRWLGDNRLMIGSWPVQDRSIIGRWSQLLPFILCSRDLRPWRVLSDGIRYMSCLPYWYLSEC